MGYLVLLSVAAVVALNASGAIPQGSVGGSLTIALVYLAAAVAVGIHDAWTRQRGVLGWILSIVLALVGAVMVTALSGDFIAMLLSDGSRSLMASGGLRAAAGLAAGMLIALGGAWGALWIVGRWR